MACEKGRESQNQLHRAVIARYEAISEALHQLKKGSVPFKWGGNVEKDTAPFYAHKFCVSKSNLA